MIRILQIGMTDNLGGIETFVMNYYRHIDREKIQFDFINIYDKLYYQDEIEALGGKVYTVASYYKHPLRYLRQVKQIIRENRYRVVHCNMNSAVFVYPLMAAKRGGAKTIIAHSHNSSSDKGLLKAVLHTLNKHLIPRYATDFFACSETAGRWFFSDKICNSDRFTVIPNAIDLDTFKPDDASRAAKRHELGIADGTLVLGHVGRFAKQKNHDFLVDVFAKVHEQRPDSVLLLVGQGPLEGEIKEKVARLGLADAVLFLGKRDDVNELYRAMDVFVLPSLYEGLGTVLIEAQACGCRALAADVVPESAKATALLDFLPLEKGAGAWATAILDGAASRTDTDDDSVNEQYDIRKASEKLAAFYREKNRIKVCHFVNGLLNGGVEQFILNSYSRLDRDEISFSVVGMREFDPVCVAKFEKAEIPIFQVPTKRESLAKNCIESIRIIKNGKFDVIHCNLSITNFFPLFYGWLCGVPVRINHAHNANQSMTPLERLLCRAGKPFTTDKVACSQLAGEVQFGKKASFTVIKNGIDLSVFKIDDGARAEMRKTLSYTEDDIVIGHVGRFSAEKNHRFILELFAALRKQSNKYKLLLVGDGELMADVKTQAQSLGVADDVTFAGSVNDVNRWLQAMDVFILPSLHEGFGISLIEAQACGLPCITSTAVTTEVKMADDVTFLPLDNMDLWAETVERFAKLPKSDNTERIRAAGYDIRESTATLLKLYTKN